MIYDTTYPTREELSPMFDSRRPRRVPSILLAPIAAITLIAGCSPGHTTTTTAGIPSIQPPPAGSCHRGGTETEPAPDPHCTPGALNPDVTPDTLAATICRSGWTKTIRPPASYTDRLKRDQIAAYGYTDTDPRHYEEDHLVSLELGGAPSDPRNLWPEPGASPNRKDTVENAAHDAVCRHQMPLSEAQHGIATDWVALGHRFGVL